MKIIVAHEGKQHSLKTAEALYRSDNLFKYITTIYDKKFSFTRIIKYLLNGNNKQKCNSRKNKNIPNEFIKQFCEIEGLILLLMRRFPVLHKIFPRFNDYLHDKFGEKVAKYAIKNNVDAVIMYDYNSNQCFKILKDKAPHIKRILDVTIANRLYSYYTYHKDADLYEDSYILKEEKDVDNIESMVRINEELKLAEYFLVGSNFVKTSLQFSNISSDKIYIVPYGVNTHLFKKKLQLQNYDISQSLTVIYVGNVCYRKGIHHLLSVVSSFPKSQIELYIIGSFSDKEEYFQKYKNNNNIHFIGFVTHDILNNYYNKADVFILPSLSEGFAQVSLEAMSCSLPIICTTNSGCNDVIEDYKNGFVIETSDRKQLKEKIEWFIKHKNRIQEMGNNALCTAKKYTWDNYFNNLNMTIKSICNEK